MAIGVEGVERRSVAGAPPPPPDAARAQHATNITITNTAIQVVYTDVSSITRSNTIHFNDTGFNVA